ETEYPEDIRNYLSGAQFALEQQSLSEYRKQMDKTTDFIASVDKQFKQYVEKVLDKAQVKKGSSLYERGISIAKAADLFGVGQWELMSYVGKTKIHDKQESRTRVGEKIRYARALFK
ncbi:hypothetical protein ACFL0V_05935, partial [Nanoarchaeota archaeon]